MALQDDINNFGSSNTAVDLLILAAKISNTTTNRTVSVATVDDLPDLATDPVEPGTVVFVDSIQIPVVAHVGCWTGLDNRELRNDCLVSILLAWGTNSSGVLGHETATACSRSSPVSVVGGFADWCQVSAGCIHSLGLRTNGTAWAWGSGGSGRLGDGTEIARSSPVIVVGGFTDWCQVSAGCVHSLGLRTDGTAWAWGSNIVGQLGHGTATTCSRSSPVSVVGGFTNWCQVSAGPGHNLGLRTDGTAWSWGSNGNGVLGHGTAAACSRSSPVSVVGGFTNWCQVSAGPGHNLGLRTDGTAWSWGNNIGGVLGHETATACSRSSPVSVVGGYTDWCQVSAGNSHSLGLRTNGTAWAWGCNSVGQLGHDTATTCSRSSPVIVVGGFTNWCQVSAGCAHSLGLRTDGTAWSWGCNGCGVLGHGTAAACARSSPVSVVGGITGWCQLAGGNNTTLGILTF